MTNEAKTHARAVFLDRDGVINKADFPDATPRAPTSLDEFQLLPGVEEALRKLKAAGFYLIVVTNQPDVSRGKIRRSTVDEITAHLLDRLRLDAVEVCFHDDADACACRKPQPGMLNDSARRFGINLARSFMVGDRWRDIEAGRRAHCTTILVGSGYGETFSSKPDATFASLADAAEWILKVASANDGVA